MVWRDPKSGEEFIISERAVVGNEVVVKIKPGASLQALADHIEAQGGIILGIVGSRKKHWVSFEYIGPDTISTAISKLRSRSDLVEDMYPNDITFAHSHIPGHLSNDRTFNSLSVFYEEQWGLDNTGQDGGTSNIDIDADEAWDIVTDAIDVDNDDV